MEQHRYTHGHHESVLRSHRWRTAENSAAYLLPYLKAGQTMLDVGCGPGTITVELAERVAPGRVAGIDASAGVIASARRDAPPGTEARFDTGDVYALAFPDGSFDVVHAHQVLQHLDDPVAALVEMRRVCKPDGVVAARDADYATFSWYPLDPALDLWLDVYHRVARTNGGEPDAGRRLLHWAQAAGFEQVSPSASTWCFATEADRQWWGDLWADRVTESDLAKSAVDQGVATTGELSSMAEGWHRWAAAPDGWLSVVHGEVICRP